jgi:predicted dehydrogenase
MRKIKIGVAGFGYWGPNLARVISKHKNAQFIAIAESNDSRIDLARELFPDVKIFESTLELILSRTIDALVVALPSNQHDEIAEAAINNGVHVLIEKPMTMDIFLGTQLAKIAQENNLVLMPGHTYIYNDLMTWAKKYIESNKLGEILYLYSQRLNLGQIKQDVNAVWSLAPHDISIFDYLTGSRATDVSATGFSGKNGIENTAFISLNYKNKILAHTHISWLNPTKTRRITIVGSKGMLVIDDTKPNNQIEIHEKYVTEAMANLDKKRENIYSIKSGSITLVSLSVTEPLLLEVSDFIESILEGRNPKATAEDGLWVAKVITAANQSIKLGGNLVEIPSLYD